MHNVGLRLMGESFCVLTGMGTYINTKSESKQHIRVCDWMERASGVRMLLESRQMRNRLKKLAMRDMLNVLFLKSHSVGKWSGLVLSIFTEQVGRLTWRQIWGWHNKEPFMKGADQSRNAHTHTLILKAYYCPFSSLYFLKAFQGKCDKPRPWVDYLEYIM